MKKENLMPSIVLGAICLVVALLLSAVNLITGPVIEANQSQAANKALLEVYPDGSFSADSKIEDLSSYALPAEITAVFKENSGGYVFQATVSGYNPGMIIMCGVDPEGKITGTKVISNNETPDIAGKVFDLTDNKGFYLGAELNAVPDLVASVTPAYTAGGYAAAVNAALNAFIVMNGGEVDFRDPEKILQDNCNAALGTEGVKYSKWFATEIIVGIDAVYEAEDGAGRVYVIGESFIGVKADGSIVNAEGVDTSAVEAANAVISASTLTDVEKPQGAKKSITKIYKTESGNYVFELTADGFSSEYYGAPMLIKLSISAEGKIIDCVTVSHEESKGYGDKCATEEYYESWRGVDKDGVVISGAPITSETTDPGAIAGATYTSNGYQRAVKAAFDAFTILTEGGNS